MYRLRLYSYIRPQTPVTYKQDNCRANTPTDKDKNSCQYAYEYDPVAGITLPPEQPCRWYRTTTNETTDRADTHTIYHRPTNRADMPTIPITVVQISLRPEHN